MNADPHAPHDGAAFHADLSRRIDTDFAAVLQSLDDLTRRTHRRFAALEARTAELSARVHAEAELILRRLPPHPSVPPDFAPGPPPSTPPQPAHAPGPHSGTRNPRSDAPPRGPSRARVKH